MVTNPPANAGDAGSIPGLGKTPGEGDDNPLENPMDKGAWRAVVHGVTRESDSTEQLNNKYTKQMLLRPDHRKEHEAMVTVHSVLLSWFVMHCSQQHLHTQHLCVRPSL